MQIGQPAGTAQPGGASATANTQVASLRIFVFALFFTFGGITSLNDVIIPKLKDLFTLSYAQAMLVQSAFFAAYFIVSLPAAAIVQRIGYMRTAVVGLLTMTAGCLLFIPASSSGMFITFLLALFVLAAGITIVQVVANPLISMLGAPATASSRLTFAQAFNSLGTTVFPYVGAILILGSLAHVDQATLSADALAAYRAAESQVVVHTYLGLAIALAIVALLVWLPVMTWLTPHWTLGATASRAVLMAVAGAVAGSAAWRLAYGVGGAPWYFLGGIAAALATVVLL